MANSPLIRPAISLGGGVALRGVPLSSHEDSQTLNSRRTRRAHGKLWRWRVNRLTSIRCTANHADGNQQGGWAVRWNHGCIKTRRKITKTSFKSIKHVKETFHRHLLLTLFCWCILCASKTVDLLSKLKSGYHAEGLAKWSCHIQSTSDAYSSTVHLRICARV